MDTLASEISAAAARMVVEEGLEYGPAKRRAVKQLGLPGRTASGNDDVEDAVLEYLSVFALTRSHRVIGPRQLVLTWMERMRLSVHILAAVWRGTATRLSDIYIQLFCDDPKSAEIALIDHRVNYIARSVQGFHGDEVDALSIHSFCEGLGEEVGVHLLIYDFDDLRGALKPDAKGRTPRGDMTATRLLLHDA